MVVPLPNLHYENRCVKFDSVVDTRKNARKLQRALGCISRNGKLMGGWSEGDPFYLSLR